MAKNITLTNLVNLSNQTTAVNAINSNNNTITTAFQDVLSLSGQAPNQMQSNLDMNSNQIINLPAPATVNSPARLIDVVTNPTITVPPTGTSGATVPFLNGNNTWSGTNTFNPEPVFQVPANTIMGNNTGSTANVTNLTQTQLTAMVNQFNATTAGDVPASGGGSSNFLRADGTWNQPNLTSQNGWAISNNGATNDATFPDLKVIMTADLVNLFNPLNNSSQVVVGPVTQSCVINTVQNGSVAGSRDTGVTSTVTITIASPAVVTWNAHGMAANTAVTFSTTGSLPTGISPGVIYYVSATGLAANSFQISASIGGASINTSGSQSGTQTGMNGVYGTADTIWFYYIWGQTPGLSTLVSKTPPMGTNANSTLGPVLPNTYTHYAPAFPIKTNPSDGTIRQWWNIGTNTAKTNFTVIGNELYYQTSLFVSITTFPINTTAAPLFLGNQYPTGNIIARMEVDAEAHNGAAALIAGFVLAWSANGNNDLNCSLYVPVASFVAAMDVVTEFPLSSSQNIWGVYLTSTGTITSTDCTFFFRGYKWPN